MVYGLRVLNSDATLNNFMDVGTANVYKGTDAVVILQLIQPEKKNIRFIPSNSAVITVDLVNADNTVNTKTATIPFADDRSIIQLSLSAADTMTLISQNLVAKIVDGGLTSYAVLQVGLKMATLASQGC